MDHQHLRAIILKLQDRLSDDDRRRLHFFLGNDVPRRIRDDPTLTGTLCLMESLFDQDKINEQDCTFLINAFSEIRCFDAVKHLREHMKRIQSNEINQPIQSLATIMSCTTNEYVRDDEEDKVGLSNVFIDEKNGLTRYNTIGVEKHVYDNSRMTSQDETPQISSESIAVRSPAVILSPIEQNISSMTRRRSIILVILIVLLAMTSIGLTVGILVIKSDMKQKTATCLEEQMKSDDTIQYLKELHMKDNATIEELAKKTKDLEVNSQITIGTTCGCERWCAKELGTPYGVCGDGHTCICRQEPITKQNVGSDCTCDAWCRKYGHKDGGICGDGYTCICST